MKEIHPNAMANFNQLALSMLEGISCRDNSGEEKADGAEMWDTVPDFEIGSKQIVPGSMRRRDIDRDGNNTGFFFESEYGWAGLTGELYGSLEKLASGVSSLAAYNRVVSQKYVTQEAENWIVERHRNAELEIDFMTYLEERSLVDVKQRTILTPIANLVVTEEFELGNLRVKPFSKSLFEELKSKCLSNPNTDGEEGLIRYLDDVEKTHRGYALIEINICCESLMAIEIATNEVEKAVSLLGIYSGHCLSVDTKNLCKIYGSENFESYSFFDVHEPYSFNKISITCQSSTRSKWEINSERLKAYQEARLDVVSNLLKKEEPNEFEERVLNSLFIYSRAAFTSDPMEKLVFTLSSLESFLLRSKSEPIQQNLGDRFAYFITRTPEYRKDLVNMVKEVYALRSDYLHHGLTKNRGAMLKDFFKQVFAFYYVVLSDIDRYSTKAEFFNFIDEMKYG